jgi:hypothetical protein
MGLSLVAARASSAAWASATASAADNWPLPRMPEGDAKAYTGRELTGLAQAAGYSALRWGPAGVRGQLLVARR